MTPLEIKALRQKLGLTQRELAEQVGVSTKAVENWEQGVRELRGAALRTVLEIQGGLKCTLDI